MFPFIKRTWNPVVGCKHWCKYCWARKLVETKLKDTKPYCYSSEGFYRAYLLPERLKVRFKPSDFVFVCDMGDLFGEWVPEPWYKEVFNAVNSFPETDFLFLTKNPRRYYFLGHQLPRNAVLGCTVESNRNYPELSRAPDQSERLQRMRMLKWDANVTGHYGRFLSVEPILDFDLDDFAEKIIDVKPWSVAVGYDNYHNQLPEPSLAKTWRLINRLEMAGIIVYRKTLREAWNEQR